MSQPPHGPWGGQQGPWGDQQQGPPPPWGAYPAGPAHQAPPKKTPTGPIVAVSLGAVAALVLGLLTVLSLAGDEKRAANSGYGQNPANPPVASPPPTSSAHTSSSAERTTSGASSTASVESGPHKVFALADHPILQDPEAGLANRACALPPWRSDRDSAMAFFTAAKECLDAAWGPFLRHYDLPFTSPTLHFPTGSSFPTECGTISVGIATAAYYCENDLYVPYAGLQTEQYGNSPGIYLALFAHEYGHHVQEVAGIMDAAWKRIYAEGQNSAEGLEMARRKELQAQCFSGMFLGAHVERGGSITRRMYERAWADQETRGDDSSGTRNHGTNAHYAQWWRAGARDNRIADCNTFAAGEAEVS